MNLSDKEKRRMRFLEEDKKMFGLVSCEESELKELLKRCGK